jgi:hypothetical protein
MEITAQRLLEEAEKCRDQSAADVFLDTFKEAFLAVPSFAGLEIANEEAYVEPRGVFVRFEANHVISNHYITMLRPKVRDGHLSVYVVTNHMKDGRGMQSQSWEMADDELEDDVNADADTTVEELVQKAVAVAIRYHASLLERLAIPHQDAIDVCRKNWKGA